MMVVARVETALNRLPDFVKTYGSLLLLASLGVYVGFQLHATLVFAALWAYQHPDIIIQGWTTETVLAWSRLMYFSLGCSWLFLVALLDSSIRSWVRQGQWLRRTLLVAGIMLGVLLLDSIIMAILV